jgi:hypothetical protein
MAREVGGSIEDLYSFLTNEERVLILVNSDTESPLLFDAGTLHTPQELVQNHLEQIVEEDDIAALLPSFGGLTLKEVSEVARLTMAAHSDLLPSHVMSIRRMLMSRNRGIAQVDTDMDFYLPPANLVKWVEHNSKIFLHCKEQRLIPRGLLFDGPPGCGKTQGAKFIATQLQIPLYILDLGTTMAKYVGESESNLSKNLQQLDQEEPCVVLLDEVEKVFKMSDDNGVTTRMLSKLLWWLQEHRSRVLVIMTTNDAGAIPTELYREGRVDKVLTFKGLEQDDACEFVKEVVASFSHIPEVKKELNVIALRCINKVKDKESSHAELTQIVYDVIKTVVKSNTY